MCGGFTPRAFILIQSIKNCFSMKKTVTVVISVVFVIAHMSCSVLPRCVLKNSIKEVHYTYNKDGDFHNYSGNWDFDGDGTKDILLFVGNGGVHLSYMPLIVLSSFDSVYCFSSILVDFPTYKPYPASGIFDDFIGFTVALADSATQDDLLLYTTVSFKEESVTGGMVHLHYNFQTQSFDITHQ